MSKYLARGPYHYVEFADRTSVYHEHVQALMDEIENLDLSKTSSVFEVGCGEGLILQQLRWHFGFRVFGCDADARAVDMARILSLGCLVEHDSNITKKTDYYYDVVMFCDSLEHIENWREHIEWAMKHSICVIIAVPDKHDPHGLRDFKLDSFDEFFKNGWKCELKKQRASRFVTIWCRE